MMIQTCSRLPSNCDERLLSIGHPSLSAPPPHQFLTKNNKSLSTTTIHQDDISTNLNRNLSPSIESIPTSLTFNDDAVRRRRRRRGGEKRVKESERAE